MTDSNTVRAGQFKKGDPRINRHGQKNKDAVAFGAAFSRALAGQGTAEELAKILWEEARKKRPWAIEMVMERLMGKVIQPMTADQNILYRIIYDKEAKGKS